MSTRRRTDEDFAAEVQAHIALETDRLIAEGLSPADARAAALRHFGNVTRARERFHDAHRAIWLEQFARDLRYAWRGLWHSRAFVATTVATLAIGMGLVTVVFAVFNAYVLRPFAVHDPYSLYAIRWHATEAGGSTFRWRDYQDSAARTDLFDGVIAESARALGTPGGPLSAGFVSGNYFDVLGARVALGRAIVGDDVKTVAAEPVAVIADRTWARLFNRDPGAIGREIEVNGRRLTIVGVMAPEFVGLDDAPRDMWVPLTMYGELLQENLFGATQPRQLTLTARLRADVAPRRAEQSLVIEPFATRVAGRIDTVGAALSPRATPARVTPETFALLSPVAAAFALVLVAACANASNVTLARANSRHREIGIRLSVGASRGRIVRQLLTEGLLVAMLAGLAGLAVAGVLLQVGTLAIIELLPPTIAQRVRFVPLDFDYRVFLFVFLVSGIVTVLFALLPALQATRVTLTDALRGQITTAIRSSTLRTLLGTSQVAVSLVLLIVAATFVRNSAAVSTTNLGLEPDGVISVRPRRGDTAAFKQAYAALGEDARLGHLAVASSVPLFGEGERVPIRHNGSVIIASYMFVAPEYFPVLTIPIERGRGFTQAEATSEAPVAIVSARTAAAFWPGQDALGQTLRLDIPPSTSRVTVADTVRSVRRFDGNSPDTIVVTVVGIAKDVVSGFIYRGTDSARIYLPTSADASRASALLVRLAPGRTVDAVRNALRDVAADPLSYDVLPLNEIVELQMFPVRAGSWIGMLLSGIALALSVSGLYGVLAYTFGQRTPEIGIRMALGASRAAVVRLVVLQSVRLASFGAAVGLLAGFSIMKLLSTVIRLENVSVIDPGAFAVSLALIAAAVGLASVGPALRAQRISPSSMLRAES